MAVLNLGQIEQVSKFKTEDGREFTNLNEARKHRVELAALQALRELLKDSIQSSQVRQGNIDNVLRQMLLEGQEIRNILRSFAKMNPKKEAA